MPTTIFLAVLTFSGSFAASAESTVADATVCELVLPESLDRESEPQADRDSAAPAPNRTAAARPRERNNTRASSGSSDGRILPPTSVAGDTPDSIGTFS